MIKIRIVVIFLELFILSILIPENLFSGPIWKWRAWPEKKAKNSAGKRAAAGRRAGEVWRDPYLGMEFVWVPGGCFEMGCGPWTSDCDDDEKPVHEVCVEGFWMGRYEVTVGQWRRFVSETGYKWNKWDCVRKYAPGMDHPVVCVSWEDAKAFAEWLSRKTGYTFRLPTEAEWEYACRSGGEKVKYAWGNGDPYVDGRKAANIADENAKMILKGLTVWEGYNDGYVYTAPVGSFASNGFGLYDMGGNVREWCEDEYDLKYYARSSRKNPKGPYREGKHTIRGGSWSDSPKFLRCANREWGWPGVRNDNLGFRLIYSKIK